MLAGEKMLNLTIELSGVILCLMGILLVVISKVDRQTRRYLIALYSGLIVFALSNMAGLLMRGLPGALWRAALYVSNFIEFLMSAVLPYLVTHYLLSILDPGRKKQRLRIVLLALLLLHIALLVVSQFTGLYYILDENNLYQRSPAYSVSYFVTAILLGIGIYLLLRHKDYLTRNERTAFWAYYVLPAASMVLQIIQYGINFVIFSTILAGLAMYVFIVQDQTERYYRQERENARLQIEIMLSQIQPHFLYNALAVIQDLCRTDPAQAEAATVQFAKYLRGNMDSLKADSTIPFEQELEHTRGYLELEKMRFEDKLTVRYDIQCADFELPTLTLQPIVENAVRHGVRGNADGKGTVTIATREYPDRFEIAVADNGPGFDLSKPGENDDRSHIGLQNVRERLERMCGGTLAIDSTPGEGTTVIITLPKGGSPK